MASQHHPQPHSGVSSQAGLAALRAHTAAPAPRPLLELIDAYAAARAERDSMYRDCAAWAFEAAHAAMLTARAAVADALGVPADALPPLQDEITATGDAYLAEARGGAL